MEQLEIELLQAREKMKSSPAKNVSAGIRQELNRLNTMYQKGRISESYYDEQYTLLSDRLTAALATENIVPIQAYRPIQDVLRDGWMQIYADLDISHKKAFWKSIIRNIYIDPHTRKVCGFSFLV